MADDQPKYPLWDKILKACKTRRKNDVSSLLKECDRSDFPKGNEWVHTLLKTPLTDQQLEVVSLLVEKFPEDVRSLKGSPDRRLEKVLLEAVRLGQKC